MKSPLLSVRNEKVRKILKSNNLIPRKSYGQNFIIDENLAFKVVKNAAIDEADIVVEIGPGLGIFTEILCNSSGKVIAVEKDTALFNLLSKTLGNRKNVVLLNKDVLSTKLEDLLPCSTKCKLISNVPYSITSDFLYWLLENRGYIESCILILQKEVAERLLAKTGTKTYGAISVFFQYYMDLEKLFVISGDRMFPATKVISQVIKVSPKRCIPAVNEKLFSRIVKSAFSHRRRQLRNGLSSFRIQNIEERYLSRRPEELGYKEFIEITNIIGK